MKKLSWVGFGVMVGVFLTACPIDDRVPLTSSDIDAGALSDGGRDAGETATGGGGETTPQYNVLYETSGTYDPTKLGDGDGGVLVADEVCTNDARLRGLKGHFIALISTSKVDARDRIPPGIRGWKNLDNAVVFDRLSDVWVYHAPGGGMMITGSSDDGTYSGHTCADWSTTDLSLTYTAGDARRWVPGYLNQEERSCGTWGALYCMQIDFSAPVVPSFPQGHRRAFVTDSTYGSGGGLFAFDQACADEAADAGLPGHYLSYTATESYSIQDRFGPDTGPGWTRLDGVDLMHWYLSGVPLQVTAKGRLVVDSQLGWQWASMPWLLPSTPYIWLGGSYGRSCTDWFAQQGNGEVTDATRGDSVNGFTTGLPCSEKAHVACMEMP